MYIYKEDYTYFLSKDEVIFHKELADMTYHTCRVSSSLVLVLQGDEKYLYLAVFKRKMKYSKNTLVLSQ